MTVAMSSALSRCDRYLIGIPRMRGRSSKALSGESGGGVSVAYVEEDLLHAYRQGCQRKLPGDLVLVGR